MWAVRINPHSARRVTVSEADAAGSAALLLFLLAKRYDSLIECGSKSESMLIFEKRIWDFAVAVGCRTSLYSADVGTLRDDCPEPFGKTLLEIVS